MLGQLKNHKPFPTSPVTAYHVTWWVPIDGKLDGKRVEKTRGSFILRDLDRAEVGLAAEARIIQEVRHQADADGDLVTVGGFAYLVMPLD